MFNHSQRNPHIAYTLWINEDKSHINERTEALKSQEYFQQKTLTSVEFSPQTDSHILIEGTGKATGS